MNNGTEVLNIINSLIAISELIVYQKAPFDNLGIDSAVTPIVFTKYLKYQNELDESLKHRIAHRQKDHTKFLLKERYLTQEKKFHEFYPNHLETLNEFAEWITMKEGSDEKKKTITKMYRKPINFPEVIKDIIKKRGANYIYKSNKLFPGLLCTTIKKLDDNEIYLLIEKGRVRNFFSIFLGIKKPAMNFDIGLFWGNSQSKFDYQSTSDVYNIINRYIDIIELMIPYIEEGVQKNCNRV